MMWYSADEPSYYLVSETSPDEVVFWVRYFLPWHTEQIFTVKRCDIPDNDDAAEWYFLQFIETELGHDHGIGEYTILIRLADEMVGAARGLSPSL